jgi:deazaflavin-dependent oxidoreductase (nitroreductase family)
VSRIGHNPHLDMSEHYRRPDWFTRHLFNPIVSALTRLGVSVAGSRVLEVPGRSSGQLRRTPVNVLTLDGRLYLVAPRGNTQWARNLRASGSGRLLVGRRGEAFTATEMADEDKPPILRAYLRRWKWEMGPFFEGIGPDSPDEEMRRIAPKHPIFEIRAPRT